MPLNLSVQELITDGVVDNDVIDIIVKKNGVERTNTLTYQRYKCNSCGAPLRGRKRIEAAPEGLTV